MFFYMFHSYNGIRGSKHCFFGNAFDFFCWKVCRDKKTLNHWVDVSRSWAFDLHYLLTVTRDVARRTPVVQYFCSWYTKFRFGFTLRVWLRTIQDMRYSRVWKRFNFFLLEKPLVMCRSELKMDQIHVLRSVMMTNLKSN